MALPAAEPPAGFRRRGHRCSGGQDPGPACGWPPPTAVATAAGDGGGQWPGGPGHPGAGGAAADGGPGPGSPGPAGPTAPAGAGGRGRGQLGALFCQPDSPIGAGRGGATPGQWPVCQQRWTGVDRGAVSRGLACGDCRPAGRAGARWPEFWPGHGLRAAGPLAPGSPGASFGARAAGQGPARNVLDPGAPPLWPRFGRPMARWGPKAPGPARHGDGLCLWRH